MGVPIEERNIFRRHLDIPRARLCEPPRKQTAQPEPPGALHFIHAFAVELQPADFLRIKARRRVTRDAFRRLQREIECLRRWRGEKLVRVVHRTDERLALKSAALPHRTRFEQPLVEFVPVGKPAGRHSLRRTHRLRGILRIWDIERTVFAAQKARGGKRLQFLAFAEIEALSDIDKRRNGRIPRPEGTRHERTDVRRCDRLRRDVAGVPVILVARVQNEAEVRGLRGPDERATVHDLRHFFEPLREPDAIDTRRDAREGGKHRL